MGFRFRRTVRLAPGLRLNLTKSGSSLSVGARGDSLNLGHDGSRRLTVGLPGTGVSYRANLGSGQRQGGLGALLVGAGIVVLLGWIAFHAL